MLKILILNHNKTLEFKMTKQKESSSFDVPLNLEEKWMMGVTSLEVYNTVYNITEKNNKRQILPKYKQLDALELDTGLVPNIKDLYKTFLFKFKAIKQQHSHNYSQL